MKSNRVNYCILIKQCILCDSQSETEHGICEACLEDLPWLTSGCTICAIPLPETSSSLICAECQKKPPSYDKVTAVFEYAFPLDRILARIKYAKKPQLLGHLARLAVAQIEPPKEIECIIPVPMHFVSQFHRGFNQSELLAAEMARLLRLPVARNLLQKVIATEKQMTLHRSTRLKNQHGVFRCKPSDFKRILLVDDVMTTGATVEAASHCLKRAGIETVEVLVLCRTER